MKKIFFLFLISLAAAYPQENNSGTKNLLILKSELKNTADAYNLQNSELNYQSEFQKKSAGLAILYSLLLPGMGELYADSYSSGKYFTIAEGALWASYIGMNAYGNWQKDRYKSFASSNGEVNTSGKDDEYFGTISQYLNVEQYNNEKALERDYIEMYNEEKYHWNWSEEDRKRYRNLWVSSEQAHNNLRFIVGALLLNRIASAVNAVRLVSAYNKRAANEMSWNVSVGFSNPVNLPTALTVNFQTGL